MRRVKSPTAKENQKKNFPLLFSAFAALCLFLSPSLASLLIVTAIFATVLTAVLCNRAELPAVSSRFAGCCAALLASLLAFLGYKLFRTTWGNSSKVAVLAGTVHLSSPALLRVVGFTGYAAGFYAMYALCSWIVSLTEQFLQKKLSEQKRTALIANLKTNWLFPISALAFFYLAAAQARGYFIGMIITLVISLIISCRMPSIWAFCRASRIGFHILSLLTTLGVCLFHANSTIPAKAQLLGGEFRPVFIGICVSVITALFAFFVYICVLKFWREMARIFQENGIFKGITAAEYLIYGTLLAASLIFVIVSFAQTEVFYGTEHSFDIIYTSDSPALVKKNVYLALTHSENDLRQPLFAVFSAPFIGIPYLIGKIFVASASVQAMLLNSVQVFLLFIANFILAKMMKLAPFKRICFMLVSCCSYTYLLFILMMEQYVIAYFWLIFCLYLLSERRYSERLALWGAGGTLLTSIVLLPLFSEKSPRKNFRSWLCNTMKYGLEFFAVMSLFCRFDIFSNLTSKASFLMRYTGRDLSITDKLYQYTAFIRNCFLAPDAGVNSTAVDHISWQLNPPTGLCFAGIAILLLAVVSAVLNKDKKSSLLAAGWVGFSIVVLLGLGWGTQENGLILYALYFGWAFFVLLFQLIEKIGDKLKLPWLLPTISIAGVIAFAAVNFPAIAEMLNFAITHFPA